MRSMVEGFKSTRLNQSTKPNPEPQEAAEGFKTHKNG